MSKKKKGKHRRTTLALVESPAQLLNVIEWAFQNGVEEQTRLAVLPPRDATTRLQLEAMVDLAREAGLAATWYEPRKSAASMVAVAWELFPRLVKAERLVVGDPFSRFVQAVLPLADVAEVVVVDDGTATISFIAQLTRGDRLSRWHLAESGREVVIDLYRVAINPAKELSIITDELLKFELSGQVLADLTKPVGGDLGQFGRLVLL